MRYAVITIIAVLTGIILLRGCESEPGPDEPIKSVIIQAKQASKTDSIVSLYDSLISEYKSRDSIHKVKIQDLTVKYNALRRVVKGLKVEKVDLVDSTIGGLSTNDYNALINSGNLCDSLLMYMDQEIAIKDSIISSREIQLQACEKLNETSQLAINDLIEINEEKDVKRKKSVKLNKKIPGLMALSTAGGMILTIILLK